MKKACVGIVILVITSFMFHSCAPPEKGTAAYYKNQASELGRYVERYSQKSVTSALSIAAYNAGYGSNPEAEHAKKELPAILEEIRRIRALIPDTAISMIEQDRRPVIAEADAIIRSTSTASN